MRLAGRLKLGFYPLPVEEVDRIRIRLQPSQEFAALDPCVGDGIAFSRLLHASNAAMRIATALKSMPIGQSRRRLWAFPSYRQMP